MDMTALDAIFDRLSLHEPRVVPPVGLRAATALIVAVRPEPSFALIRRSARHGDPWSGHAALPGGKVDPTDFDAEATARRETFEEVGIQLGTAVGRLDDIGGRIQRSVISPMVFRLEEQLPFTPDPREVAAAHWVPLSLLRDPAAAIGHPSRRFGPWPGWEYQTGDPEPFETLVIWGLTHRILSSFEKFARRN